MMSPVRRSLLLSLAAVLVLAVISPATAGSRDFVRDEFNAISYTGNDGSVAWQGGWLEAPLTNGPTAGEFQVVSDSKCAATNCLRIGPNNVTGLGAYREVDLTGSTSATLTFSFRRQLDLGGDGKMMVSVSTDGWTWSTITTYQLDTEDAGNVTQSLDLSSWAGSSLKIGFFGDGDFGGYFFVDNVQVALAANGSPTLVSSLPNRSDAEADTISITLTATDPDNDDLTFGASGLPPGISIDPDSGTISGTLGYTAAASSPFATVMTVSDGNSGVDSASFGWSVDDLNRIPTMMAIPSATADEEVALQIAVDADDPDLPGDLLTFSLTSAPAGATINQSGVIAWTPSESSGPGIYGFTVKVKDSAGPPASVVRSFSVSVFEVNASPVVAYIPDQALGAGDTMSYPVIATDPDLPPNNLTFGATGLPPGVRIDLSTGVMNGTIPSDTAQSTGTATVTVEDSGIPREATTKTFSWLVTRGNHAPVLAPIPDQNPESGGSVSFTSTATDADTGDTLNYWLADGIDAVPSGASIDPDTGKFYWKPTEAEHGTTYLLNVGVSDSGSPRLSDTQLVTIVVPKINQAPEVVRPARQRSAEGDSVVLDVAATDPDATDALRFAAVGLPSGLLINSVNGTISGTVDYEAAADSPYTVKVTATDNGQPVKSATVSFEWEIDNTNRPPTATPAEVIAIVGEETAITLIAADPDDDDLEYTIAVAPVFGTLEGTGSDMVYVSSGGGDADSFTFVVSDGEFEAEAEVGIEIRTANTPPTAESDEYVVDEGVLLEVGAPGVLANDSDGDGEQLIAVLVGGPDNGRLVFNADGSFTYMPGDGFSGGDKFVYVATDAFGAEATATVVLTVNAAEVVALPLVDDGPRLDVVGATNALWQPAASGGDGFMSEIPRAIVASLNSGISTLPKLGFPLLLLAIALLLALTIGRISYLPAAAARKHEQGYVKSYDDIHGLGRVVPVDGDDEVFVHGRALDNMETLQAGQRVEFVAADVKGRRIALRVWAATT